MGAVQQFPGAMPPMPAVARILARYDRDKLEAFIAVAIDLIDTLDGPHDPDAPDFRPRSDGQPGDPAEAEHSGDERDFAWPEWRSNGRNIPNSPELSGYAIGSYEDDEADDFGEEDDPAGQCDEDGMNTGNGVPHLHGGFDHSGPGCPISDPGEPDGLRLRKVKAGEDWEPQCT